jgi:hypothetical protein
MYLNNREHALMMGSFVLHGVAFAVPMIPIILFVALAFLHTGKIAFEPESFRTTLLTSVVGLTAGITVPVLTVSWASIFGWRKGLESIARWVPMAVLILGSWYPLWSYVEVLRFD